MLFKSKKTVSNSKPDVTYNCNIYAVYDKIDSCHTQIFLSRSDVSAARYFLQKIYTANEMVTMRYKNQGLDVPAMQLTKVSDYELHKIARFDDIFGSVEPLNISNVSLKE